MTNSKETMITHSESIYANRYFLALLAAFILPISGISIDIYVPSLPAVSHYFAVSKAWVQLSVTAYMVGLGLMQLIAGGISDSFGRKKPFIFAMSIYLIATLWIPWSQHIFHLIVLRFVQGLAAAVIIVPVRSIIADLFEGKEFYKMATYMTMAWSIGPIVAPAIGGYLQHYFGWQSNFYFLVIYCLMAFILIAIYMPETSRYRHSFSPKAMYDRSVSILLTRKFSLGLIINGLLYSLAILFAVVGPFLIQRMLHYSSVEFGYVALLAGLAWFLGAMTNRFLIGIASEKKSKCGLILMLLISIATYIISLLTPLNIYIIVIPIFVLLWIGGTLFPDNFARGVSLFPTMTGSANALFGSFVFLISGISSSFGAVLKSSTQLPLVITYIAIIGICLILNYFQYKE